MSLPVHARRLERLRAWRVRTTDALSIGEQVEALARRLKRTRRDYAGLDLAWDELVPARLTRSDQFVSLSRGILTVRVPDAPVRFELDRWLRAGGELALRRRCPALAKVRLSM